MRAAVTVVAAAALACACSAAGDRNGAGDRDAAIAANRRSVWNRYALPSVNGAHHRPADEAQALVEMIAHHDDAVGAASEYAAVTDCPELADFAARIVRVQGEQVATMQSWLDEWYPASDRTSSWQPMFAAAALRDDDAFLSTMIDHHRHAVEMYAGWVADGIVEHDELGQLASRIAHGQEGEIATMQQLRALCDTP